MELFRRPEYPVELALMVPKPLNWNHTDVKRSCWLILAEWSTYLRREQSTEKDQKECAEAGH